MQGVMVRIAVSVFGLATLAMLLLALYNDKGYFAVHSQHLKLNAIQTETQSLETEIQNLRKEGDDLEQGDPELIEKHGREDLGLVKPNEVTITVSEEPADPAPANNK